MHLYVPQFPFIENGQDLKASRGIVEGDDKVEESSTWLLVNTLWYQL